MMELGFENTELQRNLVSTAVLLAAVLALRLWGAHHIGKLEIESVETRRRFFIYNRNGALLLLMGGIVVIWATELRYVAVSMIVILSAVVLATKELILCLLGGFYRAAMDVCHLGDRIDVNGVRGDVIDMSLFSITILEVGPGPLSQQRTGRAVTIPNALFLTTPVHNESYLEQYMTHFFTVPLSVEEDWRHAEELLLHAAHVECLVFLDEAKAYLHELQEKMGLDTPSADPRVTIRFAEAGKLTLICRFPVPTMQRLRVEQAILRRFLEAWTAPKPCKEPAAPATA